MRRLNIVLAGLLASCSTQPAPPKDSWDVNFFPKLDNGSYFQGLWQSEGSLSEPEKGII
jgi:hypothetical protein